MTSVSAYFARRTTDPQIVADLTSDTFVGAITSFGTFDPGKGTVRAWLFGIARRVFAQHCERCSRESDVVARLTRHRSLDIDEAAELVARIDAEHASREMLDGLADLPPIDRELVELMYLSGLTPRDAAAAIGVSPGAMRIRLFRTRT